MNSELYPLLPAHIRSRDLAAGGALKALFELMQNQSDIVEADIRALGESWFIETCPQWAIYYIGQLLDVEPLHDLGPDSGFSPRAWVGNTIHNRQRKGTLAAIEDIAREATGLPARAVQMFARLSATAALNQLRPERLASAPIGDGDRSALIGSAFDQSPRTVDVRRIDRGGGRYNIPNIAIHLWRLQAYPLQSVGAFRRSGQQFQLDPLGRDMPIFWSGASRAERGEVARDGGAAMIELPLPLRRRPLYRETEAMRQAICEGQSHRPSWFGAEPAVAFEIQWQAGDPFEAIDPAAIAICDLHDSGGGNWRLPPPSLDYRNRAGASASLPIAIGFDPLRGRAALPPGSSANALRASYRYGAPGDVGGGPYERRSSAEDLLGRAADFQVGVSQRLAADGNQLVATLAEAVALWNARPPGQAGLIVLMDNDSFDEDLSGADAVQLAAGSALAIIAADWPELPRSDGGSERRRGQFVARGRRACLRGELNVETTVDLGDPLPCRFALNGLLIDGPLNFSGAAGSAFGRIDIAHCSIAPGHSIALSEAAIETQLSLYRSIAPSLELGEAEADVRIEQCLIDGAGGAAIRAADSDVNVQGSTLIGATEVGQISAGDSIFDGTISAARSQAGCLQYCYYHSQGSRTPRRYRCQPDLALAGQAPAQRPGIVAALGPLYVSTEFGQPGYGQLADNCAQQLLRGAAAGGSMGVWGFMQFPWRQTNLEIASGEYLPFGLMAGAFYQT